MEKTKIKQKLEVFCPECGNRYPVWVEFEIHYVVTYKGCSFTPR